MRVIAGLIVLVVVVVSAGSAQIQSMWASSGYATTSWTAFEKTSYARIVYVEVTNDTTVGSQLLYVAFNTDTSSTQRFGLKWGETLTLSGVNLSKFQIKTSTGTIPYRVRYH